MTLIDLVKNQLHDKHKLEAINVFTVEEILTDGSAMPIGIYFDEATADDIFINMMTINNNFRKREQTLYLPQFVVDKNKFEQLKGFKTCESLIKRNIQKLKKEQ